MKDLTVISAQKLKTLEQYASALVVGMLSLNTLCSFHEKAIKEGLLDQDEEEKAVTIIWEFRRIFTLYEGQLDQIMERVEMTKEEIVSAVKDLLPEVKKGRRKKDGKDQHI